MMKLLPFVLIMITAMPSMAKHHHHKKHHVGKKHVVVKHYHQYDRQHAYTYNHKVWAKVVDSQPIIEYVKVKKPVKVCYQVKSKQHINKVSGGILGAAIGYQLGHDKASKRLGAFSGAVIGSHLGKKAPQYRYHEECYREYQYETQSEVVGYQVTYKLGKRYYKTELPHQPGRRILVRL